jgi:hypothetical protein
MRRRCCTRPWIPPSTMSDTEREILTCMRYGGSLQSASQLADQCVCTVQRWIEARQAKPGGPHSEFSREASKLECRHALQTSTLTGCRGTGLNGNGSNGNGQYGHGTVQIVRWDD